MTFNVKTELDLIQSRIGMMTEEAVNDFDSVTEIDKLNFAPLGDSALGLIATTLSDHPAVNAQITDKAALKDLLIKVGDDLHRGYNEAVESHFN